MRAGGENINLAAKAARRNEENMAKA